MQSPGFLPLEHCFPLSSKALELICEDVQPQGGAATHFVVFALRLKDSLILLSPLTSVAETFNLRCWKKNHKISLLILGLRSLWCLWADKTHHVQILFLLQGSATCAYSPATYGWGNTGSGCCWYIPLLRVVLTVYSWFPMPWQSRVTTTQAGGLRTQQRVLPPTTADRCVTAMVGAGRD